MVILTTSVLGENEDLLPWWRKEGLADPHWHCGIVACGRWHLSNIQLTTLSVHHFYEHAEVPMDSLYDARDLARSLFFWMPANIFVGPRHRADDPGHHFEVNARFILQDDATLAVLRNINNAMDDYLRTENVADFNRAIELLVNFLPGARVEPYPFNIDQWLADHQAMVDGIMRHFYRINPNPQIRPYYMKRGVTNAFYQKDPLCILPDIYYDMALKQDDLLVAATVFERTENAAGFKKKYSYGSWREWLEASSWQDGIFSYGIAGYGKNMAEDKYGYYFYDKSFVAGLTGTDLSFGKDSWTNNHNWDVNSFGGQIYFDKNGRAVALAVGHRVDTKMNQGWLYYYTERKWKFLTNDNIVEALASVMPNGRTESMDAKAMRFPAKKIKISPDDGRDLRSADNRK